MTKKHFEAAAQQIKLIKASDWHNYLPSWGCLDEGCLGPVETLIEELGNVSPSYIRAVWTAQAYISLFEAFNPQFNRTKFLQACGFLPILQDETFDIVPQRHGPYD